MPHPDHKRRLSLRPLVDGLEARALLSIASQYSYVDAYSTVENSASSPAVNAVTPVYTHQISQSAPNITPITDGSSGTATSPTPGATAAYSLSFKSQVSAPGSDSGQVAISGSLNTSSSTYFQDSYFGGSYQVAGTASQAGTLTVNYNAGPTLPGNTVVANFYDGTYHYQSGTFTYSLTKGQSYSFLVTYSVEHGGQRFGKADQGVSVAASSSFTWSFAPPVQLPNLAMLSATINGSTINYAYKTSGTPGTFTAGLYESSNSVYDKTAKLISTQSVASAPNSSGAGTFTLNFTPPPSSPYFFVVANPFGSIVESKTSDNSALVVRNLAWGAKVSAQFRSKVVLIANQLGTDPSYLMAAMAFETGRTFSPSVANAAGSGAVGLIQFLPSTAKALGTTTAALVKMTAEQQLDYVGKYFTPYAGRLATLADVYMAILYPKAIGQGGGFVLFDSTNTPTAYAQNKGLDTNHDGKVTVTEASQLVSSLLQTGQSTGNVYVMTSYYA
jgi:hypothetical protein